MLDLFELSREGSATHGRCTPLPEDSIGTVTYHHFSDVEELAAFVPEDVSLTQLTCQPFDCNSVALRFEGIQFSFNHVNCNLHAFGEKHPGFLPFTCLIQGQTQPVVEDNRRVTEDYLFGFDPNREANLVFPGNAIHCAIHIRQDVFEACAEAMDRPDLNTKFLASNHVYIPGSILPLRAFLSQLYALLNQRSPLLQTPNFQQIILQDFLPLLITTLPIPQDRKRPVRAFRRSHLVKQANDYMQAHIDESLTLMDLCQALGTSSRALCYGFQEIFGMSPMAYLKVLRLQGAYRVLKAANPKETTITQVASQFGFYHLGYFAQDYKQIFGELPSQTLSSTFA